MQLTFLHWLEKCDSTIFLISGADGSDFIHSHVYFLYLIFPSVAEGVTAISQAIDAQDERLLMAALTYPRASIYGVTPKCIQEYLEELKKLKDSKIEEGQ